MTYNDPSYTLYLYQMNETDGKGKYIKGNIRDLNMARAMAIETLADVPVNPKTGAKNEVGIHDDEGHICGYVRNNGKGYSWFNWSGNGSGSHRLNPDGTIVKRKKRKDAKMPFGL